MIRHAHPGRRSHAAKLLQRLPLPRPAIRLRLPTVREALVAVAGLGALGLLLPQAVYGTVVVHGFAGVFAPFGWLVLLLWLAVAAVAAWPARAAALAAAVRVPLRPSVLAIIYTKLAVLLLCLQGLTLLRLQGGFAANVGPAWGLYLELAWAMGGVAVAWAWHLQQPMPNIAVAPQLQPSQGQLL